MERELFPEFYFGSINGTEAMMRSGKKKLQPNESQFVDFNFTTTKQNATRGGAGTTQRGGGGGGGDTMVVNFSHLPIRSINSIDAPLFNDANLGSDMGESSTSMDSMGIQEKEKVFFEKDQSNKANKRKGKDASELDFQSKVPQYSVNHCLNF